MTDELNNIVAQLNSGLLDEQDNSTKPGDQAIKQNQTVPPVHLWEPDFCGDIDIRIDQEGAWYYMGSPIGRTSLVKLFSSVLRLDDDGHYYLVTPVEKLRIKVDIAPFVAISADTVRHQDSVYLAFTTKEGWRSLASAEHPIMIRGQGESMRPFVNIRKNLDALIHRNLYYQLIDTAEHRVAHNQVTYGVTSGGVFFPIAEPVAMDEIT